MVQKTLKIVWLCHFTNEEIQNQLPLWKSKDEFASWIPNMVRGFQETDDVELHIISPHEFLKHKTRFEIRNVHYYFIPVGIPVWHRHWPRYLRYDVLTNFHYFQSEVLKIVKEIKPDLINLIGAENAYYCSSIFRFEKTYPILVTIQGFISQMRNSIKLTHDLIKRIYIEEKILKSFKYFAGEQDSSNYIINYNRNHIFFKLYFPINENLALNTKYKVKKYDCIYFGRLSKIKGTEDFIKVIAEIKVIKPDVKACIVGGGKNLNYWMDLVKRLNCSENIEFTGFVKTQKELFEYVKASKVFLAPPHFERLSSTIREAMFLKVPIVSYATGGIPYINEFDENIYLVETGDYKAMAKKSLLLLNNDNLRKELAEKAFLYASREFSLKVNTERTLNGYNIIMDNFKNNF